MTLRKTVGLCLVLAMLILLVLPVVWQLQTDVVKAGPLPQRSPLPTHGPTSEPPTAEPPTAEPPTAEPPTAEPPTAEPPPTSPPQTALPPLPTGELPTDQPPPTGAPGVTATPAPSKPEEHKDEGEEEKHPAPTATPTFFPTQRDLQVTARRSVETAPVNTEVVYTIRVRAVGATIRDVRVFFEAPAAVTIVDAEMNTGKVESISGNLLTFQVGSMTAGLETEFKIKTVAQSAATAAQFTGKAWATGDFGLVSVAVQDVAVGSASGGVSAASISAPSPAPLSRGSSNAPIVPTAPVSGIIPPIMPVTGGGTIAIVAGLAFGALLALSRLLRRK